MGTTTTKELKKNTSNNNITFQYKQPSNNISWERRSRTLHFNMSNHQIMYHEKGDRGWNITQLMIVSPGIAARACVTSPPSVLCPPLTGCTRCLWPIVPALSFTLPLRYAAFSLSGPGLYQHKKNTHPLWLTVPTYYKDTIKQLENFNGEKTKQNKTLLYKWGSLLKFEIKTVLKN